MGNIRRIRLILDSKATLEGAGVHLQRAFGAHEVPMFDPFLLLDDFRSDNPDHYIKGFPWHPHRGMETITYVLEGDVEHGDSMGNQGIISSGDVQWMTAGSGIVHQEMPRGDPRGHMFGFQLWANLPATQKMMPPRYRDVKSDQIPDVPYEDGVRIKIISGIVGGTRGPVGDIVIDPEYLDISVPAHSRFLYPVKPGHTVFAYVIEGSGVFSEDKDPSLDNRTVILFEDGDSIMVTTQDHPLRFLLISGKPIGEPVAWYGPIVMNTQKELELAFEEYEKGTFIHQKG